MDDELATLAEEETKLEAWAAALQSQALALEAQRARVHARRARELELHGWSARLQAQVSHAVALLDDQRREELDKCAAFDESLVANIAALEGMRVGVRRRAEALDASYAQTAHRMCILAEEALLTRRAQLEAEFPPAQRPARFEEAACGGELGDRPPAREPARRFLTGQDAGSPHAAASMAVRT